MDGLRIEEPLIDVEEPLVDVEEPLIDLDEPAVDDRIGTDQQLSRLVAVDNPESTLEVHPRLRETSSTWERLNTGNILKIMDDLKIFSPPDPVEPASHWDTLKAIDSLVGFGPPTKFRYFSCLPTELREMIWRWALVEEVSQRLVILSEDTYSVLRPDNLVSPLLSANRESRQQATAFYEVRLEISTMPPVIVNTSHQPGRHGVSRQELDAEVAKGRVRDGKSTDTLGEVVGVCYISAIRDTFVPLCEVYEDVPITWELPREVRLSTEPLLSPIRSRIRRLAQAWSSPSFYSGPGTGVMPAVDLVETVGSLEQLAQFGWQQVDLSGVRHHGVHYIHCMAPNVEGRTQQFADDVWNKSRRGSYRFKRFIKRIMENGSWVWAPEMDESLLGLRPFPEQTFALTLEDLEDLPGQI